MTRDEIKATHTVPDILSRYGVQVRSGRCRAICHDGRRYTAKVSDGLYYCFKCDKSMDVFDIVQHFEGCDFRTAFELLGGGERPSLRARVLAQNNDRERRFRQWQRQKTEKDLDITLCLLHAYRSFMSRAAEYTEEWTLCYNRVQYLEYKLDALMKGD